MITRAEIRHLIEEVAAAEQDHRMGRYGRRAYDAHARLGNAHEAIRNLAKVDDVDHPEIAEALAKIGIYDRVDDHYYWIVSSKKGASLPVRVRCELEIATRLFDEGMATLREIARTTPDEELRAYRDALAVKEQRAEQSGAEEPF